MASETRLSGRPRDLYSKEGQIFQGSEQQPKPRHCLVIPAMTATQKQAERVLQGLTPEYGGKENVTVFNSTISIDKPNTQRLEEMAQVIMDRARSGLDIVAVSLGAVELWKALRIIHRKDKDFFTDPLVKENLHFIFDGPAGFNKGIMQRIRYLKAYPKINSSLEMGLDALTAFPPQGIAASDLTNTLSELSNKREGFAVEPFENIRDNTEYLSDADRKTLADYDEILKPAVAQSEAIRASEIINARGDAVKENVLQIFSVEGEEKKRKLLMRVIKSTATLVRSLGAKPMKKFQKLSDMGYAIDFILPEYDFLVPFRTIMSFFKGREEDARPHVRVVEQSNHSGFALQPEQYARAIRRAGKRD